MNDLRELMRENVAAPPPDHLDLATLVRTGRRRVRARRTAALGGAAAAAVAVVAVTTLGLSSGPNRAAPSDALPRPDAPTLTLGDATRAVEGADYRVLASYTNDNLDHRNGQYFDGVTDDGMVLFRDGRPELDTPRYALMNPATGAKDWLPAPPFGGDQTIPLELGADQLVLLGLSSKNGEPTTYAFARSTRAWSTLEWPGLPQGQADDMFRPGPGVMGPDGRLYVRVPATRGQIPDGGWPTDAHGEADDSNAEGDTYHLWSVSLTDPADARDEDLIVGNVAFTDTAMVWTDSTNGAAGLVHVRDLATGQEHSFDPHTADRCNLLSFGASGNRVMMSQFCGEYDSGRDDRVQILSTDGDQVVTVQDSGIEGSLSGGVVTITSYQKDRAGTYVYDLATDRLLRLSDGVGKFWMGYGPTPEGQFLWSTPVNGRHGATQSLGELVR